MSVRLAATLRALRRRVFPGPVAVVAAGPARGLRIDPGAGNPDFVSGTYEPPVQAAVAARLAPGDLMLDVGANVGFLAILAARLVGPGGRVVAFEPVPGNASLVRRNAGLNGLGNLEVIESAVGDRCGSATLVLARHCGGAALSGTQRPPDACGEIEVRLTTLDAWWAGAGRPRPSFVKVDVEGGELDVLRGARQMLSSVRPCLLVEVDDATPAGAAAKAAACEGCCRELGYSVERLPAAYGDIGWQVVHLLATAPSDG